MSIEAITSSVTAAVALVGVPAVYIQARAARLSAVAAGRAQLEHARRTSQHAACVAVLATADELKRSCDVSGSAASWLGMIYEGQADEDESVRARAAAGRQEAEQRQDEAFDHAFEAYERLRKAVARLELKGPDRLIAPAARLADMGDLLQLPGGTPTFDEDEPVWVTEHDQRPFTWVVSQFQQARTEFVQGTRTCFNSI
ncbi:hypothetical protein AB0948_25070 [Streptomyces koyangensis]|uniref:hypothetical protein n=1 Tax=Streptomyces koyangensis TaxID=188770 RepID=UPI003454CABF